ncbi:hypothetical protein TRVL_00574 [Trypanosoma vivax]|uniref:Uncharacterized protein n=1 Tax=Trypanosoma vivax (strain Y486) TaxID=1055687 RepID=G0U075_TRYVY|nr:hypothetical protein TRVL_00574 [Trypanosoma vivax]CCC49473.1 hypothetical protein TVY486_0800810 [Trypanosoma vivax Y486]
MQHQWHSRVNDIVRILSYTRGPCYVRGTAVHDAYQYGRQAQLGYSLVESTLEECDLQESRKRPRHSDPVINAVRFKVLLGEVGAASKSHLTLPAGLHGLSSSHKLSGGRIQ